MAGRVNTRATLPEMFLFRLVIGASEDGQVALLGADGVSPSAAKASRRQPDDVVPLRATVAPMGLCAGCGRFVCGAKCQCSRCGDDLHFACAADWRLLWRLLPGLPLRA